MLFADTYFKCWGSVERGRIRGTGTARSPSLLDIIMHLEVIQIYLHRSMWTSWTLAKRAVSTYPISLATRCILPCPKYQPTRCQKSVVPKNLQGESKYGGDLTIQRVQSIQIIFAHSHLIFHFQVLRQLTRLSMNRRIWDLLLLAEEDGPDQQVPLISPTEEMREETRCWRIGHSMVQASTHPEIIQERGGQGMSCICLFRDCWLSEKGRAVIDRRTETSTSSPSPLPQNL